MGAPVELTFRPIEPRPMPVREVPRLSFAWGEVVLSMIGTLEGKGLAYRARNGDVNFDGSVTMEDFIPFPGCFTDEEKRDGLCECRFWLCGQFSAERLGLRLAAAAVRKIMEGF